MLPASAPAKDQLSTIIVNAAFDPTVWSAVPFHFWSVVFFVLGSMVGSFLNVCIHRLPLGQSIVSPGSHCPACNYAIPWYLNIPLLTWVYLGGKCQNCGAPISARYFLVELLTAVLFCACWLAFGAQSVWLALIYGALRESGLGIAVGAGIIYFFVRMGKLVWGRETLVLPPDTKIIFTENGLVFPDKEISYDEVFYRPSDIV